VKLINKTVYRTADLKALFYEAARHSPVIMDSGVKELIVKVSYARNSHGGISGRAYVGKVWHHHNLCYFMCIMMPATIKIAGDTGHRGVREPFKWTPKEMRKLAWVFIHELMHCAGKEHKDMRGGYFNKWDDPAKWGDPDRNDLSWADAFEVRREEPKPGKSAEKRNAEKLAHAAAMLKKHESDLKRKQNLVKKWKRKVKYYENRDAKLAAVKGG